MTAAEMPEDDEFKRKEEFDKETGYGPPEKSEVDEEEDDTDDARWEAGFTTDSSYEPRVVTFVRGTWERLDDAIHDWLHETDSDGDRVPKSIQMVIPLPRAEKEDGIAVQVWYYVAENED